MSTSGNRSTSQPPGPSGNHDGSHRRRGGDLAGEHALTDIGQLALLAVFLGVWITDSFVFHYTTSWTMSWIRSASPALIRVTDAARLVLSAAVLTAAGVLAHRSYAAVFGRAAHSGRLLTRGVYAIVRHPMYLGGWLLVVGLTIMTASAAAAVVCVVVFLFYSFVAGREERLLQRKFGDEYLAYAARVPKLIPWTLGRKLGRKPG